MKNKTELLTPEQESTLLEKASRGDREARNELVIRNQGFIYKVLQKYKTYGIAEDDLIQAGNLGLIEAIETFDLKKSKRLSTYAYVLIRKHMQLEIEHMQPGVSLPTGALSDRASQYRKGRERLMEEFQREPTVAEVDEDYRLRMFKRGSKFNTGTTHKILLVAGGPIDNYSDSLDKNHASYVEFMADKTIDIAEEVNQIFTSSGVRKILKESLSEKERRVIEMRFGFTDDVPKKLREIGNFFGVTREAIRQLESTVLARLKRPLQNFI